MDALIHNHTCQPDLVREPSTVSSTKSKRIKDPHKYHGGLQQFMENDADSSNMASQTCTVRLHDTPSVKSFNSSVKKIHTQTLI